MSEDQLAGHHRRDDIDSHATRDAIRFKARCECGWEGPRWQSRLGAYLSWLAHVRAVVGKCDQE